MLSHFLNWKSIDVGHKFIRLGSLAKSVALLREEGSGSAWLSPSPMFQLKPQPNDSEQHKPHCFIILYVNCFDLKQDL